MFGNYFEQLFFGGVGEHGQNRSEYFLLHSGVVNRGGIYNGRFDFAFFVVEIAAARNIAADKVFDAVVMARADYFAVTVVAERVGVELGDILF